MAKDISVDDLKQFKNIMSNFDVTHDLGHASWQHQ